MKSLMSLWTVMAEDLAITCCTSATLDINTVKRRVEREGLSFLTITLPDLGKATQKWLDQGHAEFHPSFYYRRGRSLPEFLQGFFVRVFDPVSGVLLDEPDIDAIFAIRQLTLSFAKILHPCTRARVEEAMSDFVRCEREVREFDAQVAESDLDDFERVSNLLFGRVFSKMDSDIQYGTLLPKHGPGATADKLTSNGKYQSRAWTTRLEKHFPSHEFLIPNIDFIDELDKESFSEPGAELPVRVISVPKTMKTPRIIAIEPSCMQYAQQALLRCFLDHFYRDELLQKFIGFDDQTPNQELALSGSIEGQTATLDLSEASDRVSNQLVRTMLRRWPHLQGAVDACRSRRADVPGLGVIRLAKYASMGSALCFPMEAMVFTTIIFLGIQKALNTSLTREDIKSFSGSVRVYGDDLIVPIGQVRTIVQELEHFGARVGLSKSFWTGKFRESCGKEYYDGRDVSISRVRRDIPTTIADATEVISTVSLRNQLAEAGYFPKTVEWLDSRLRKILKYFPEVGPDSSVLGRVCRYVTVTESPSGTVSKWHPTLHTRLVRGYYVHGRPPTDPVGESSALLKCLLRLESRFPTGVVRVDTDLLPCYEPSPSYDLDIDREASLRMPSVSQDEKHLERSGRPKRVSIKLGWRPAL
uniref:RNA-directed RNA polymerase n=1 Tax=Leviviridae sp. TaxID=2027243 RepID=A0A514D7T5_9VIRU|nr:MAG: RNA-dependent RNA polymerase [Leviviridae sp.]